MIGLATTLTDSKLVKSMSGSTSMNVNCKLAKPSSDLISDMSSLGDLRQATIVYSQILWYSSNSLDDANVIYMGLP